MLFIYRPSKWGAVLYCSLGLLFFFKEVVVIGRTIFFSLGLHTAPQLLDLLFLDFYFFYINNNIIINITYNALKRYS